MTSFPSIVDLNVGGVRYTASISTLTSEPNSLLQEIFTGKSSQQLVQDSQVNFLFTFLHLSFFTKVLTSIIFCTWKKD